MVVIKQLGCSDPILFLHPVPPYWAVSLFLGLDTISLAILSFWWCAEEGHFSSAASMLLKTGKSETVALEAEPKFRNEVRREVGKRFQGMVSRKEMQGSV